MRSDVAAERKNHVGLAAHQSRGEFRKPLRPTLREMIFKRDVLSVNVAKLAKTFHESLCIRILVGCAVNEDSDARDGAPLAVHAPKMAGFTDTRAATPARNSLRRMSSLRAGTNGGSVRKTISKKPRSTRAYEA